MTTTAKRDRANWEVRGDVTKYTDEQLAHAARSLGIDVDEVTSATMRELAIEPDAVEEFEGNLLLLEGVAEMWDLIIGATADAFSNANARLGVGNSGTAAADTDTDLLGASTLYKAMNATYPKRVASVMDFQADFTTGEANFAWLEWSVDNGNSQNMNRKVVNLGTKVSGLWTLTVSITLS